MKKLIALTLVALPLAWSARAQYIVYDPTMNIQQIIDEAESIAKYVQMIDNQVQQIQTLTDQLNQFEHYEALFGDPSKVTLPMVTALDSDLQSLEPVQSLENLVVSADGNAALTFNDAGIYATVAPVSRPPAARPSSGQRTNTNRLRPSSIPPATTSRSPTARRSGGPLSRIKSRRRPSNSRTRPRTRRCRNCTACSPA